MKPPSLERAVLPADRLEVASLSSRDAREPAHDAKREVRSEPRDLVVGVDGSRASLEALRWAVGLAERSDSPVRAVYAFTPSDAEVSPARYASLHAEAGARLRDWCAATGIADSVDPFVVDGDPSTLLTIAGQTDLVVVGTRGDYGFAHLHLGSVAHHLVHHTSVPLAIVPTRAAHDRVSRIVIGVDGSAGSEAAVSFVASLAHAVDAPVVAVHATDAGSAVPVRERVHQWIAPLEAGAAVVEVEISTDLVPVAAMNRAIATEPDTLAVVGTRGLGGFSGLRLGGVATHLAHTCDAAVVLVPPPEPLVPG